MINIIDWMLFILVRVYLLQLKKIAPKTAAKKAMKSPNMMFIMLSYAEITSMLFFQALASNIDIRHPKNAIKVPTFSYSPTYYLITILQTTIIAPGRPENMYE